MRNLYLYNAAHIDATAYHSVVGCHRTRISFTGKSDSIEIGGSLGHYTVKRYLFARSYCNDIPYRNGLRIDRNKLTQAIAGAKGGSRVECYRYADDKTVDLVYNQISYETAPDLEPRARESHETALSGGGKMFTIVTDGMYYLVLFRGDTLIYACSPDSLTEINEILVETGYLRR